VVRTDALSTNDGFKFWTDDGSWLLVRFSGTEPLVRVYAEATSAGMRDEMLDQGARMVRGDGATGH
jgi:phosphomannomutase